MMVCPVVLIVYLQPEIFGLVFVNDNVSVSSVSVHCL